MSWGKTEHCQEIKHIEAKNIDLQQKGKNTSIHRIVDCLCTCAPRLESIDIDLFENPSNKMLLMSKMKTVMNQIRNNYTNVAFNLPFENITQSSYNVDKSRNGSLAVDGKMSSRFGEAWCDHSATTTMTGVDIEAFLELDLQRVHNVREVFVKLPDDRHGTKMQFPIYLFTSLKPFKKRYIKDILKMDYLVTATLFEHEAVGFKVAINKKIRYVRVQHACINGGMIKPRCLSVGQIVVRKQFLFLKYIEEKPAAFTF